MKRWFRRRSVPASEKPCPLDAALYPNIRRIGRWTVFVVCLLLVAAVWIVFGQTRHHEFVNYDDHGYIYENPVVLKGLTKEGVVWASTYGDIGHWHPVTWFTHMLDVQLFGLNAGGHHLTNVALHTLTVILLFLLLLKMAGALWRSAFVAAVFAIHPLRVESVAWISERKDVLSGLFFVLTIWAYFRYVRQKPSLWRYLTVVFLFALGLMSKGMLVTVPFVLLLLDFWPLGRLRFEVNADDLKRESVERVRWARLVVEKIPLFVLSLGSCIATRLSPERVPFDEQLPLVMRLGNAVVSYVIYLRQMVWPSGLAAPYTYPANGFSLPEILSAIAVVATVTFLAFRYYKRSPYFLVGWLWYLGTLVPVIGLVQISYYPRADRYTYLPQIGLYIFAAWGVADFCAKWKYRKAFLFITATGAIASLMLVAYTQTGYWRTSISLWTRALACTSRNYVAHNNLGILMSQRGLENDAILHFKEALQIKPEYAEATYNLGVALTKRGDLGAGVQYCERAIQLQPNRAEAHNNLGVALATQGRWDEAVHHYERAIQLKPLYADAFNNLGNALTVKGKLDEAVQSCERALQLIPDFAEAHFNLANALAARGRANDAINHYEQALQLKPEYAEAHNNLGTTLGLQRKFVEAAQHCQRACELRPDFIEAHNNFAIALGALGRWEEAIQHYDKVVKLRPGDAGAYYNLGNALLATGKTDESMAQFSTALSQKPDLAEAHYQMAVILSGRKNHKSALDHFRQAIRVKPNWTEALNNVSWLLSTTNDDSVRDGREALKTALSLAVFTGENNANTLDTLAAAYAEIGQFQEALECETRAAELLKQRKNEKQLAGIQSRLELFALGKPYREQ